MYATRTEGLNAAGAHNGKERPTSIPISRKVAALDTPYTDFNCSRLRSVYVYGCTRCNVSRWAGGYRIIVEFRVRVSSSSLSFEFEFELNVRKWAFGSTMGRLTLDSTAVLSNEYWRRVEVATGGFSRDAVHIHAKKK